MSKTCVYEYQYGRGTSCKFSQYKDHSFCIFHSPRVKEKQDDFQGALQHLIELCEADERFDSKGYDFEGFIFPEIRMNLNLEHSVNFIGAQFTADANFAGWQFKENVDFDMALFAGEADFSKVRFLERADFRETQFNGRVNFSNTYFEEDADFTKAHFKAEASFTNMYVLDGADFPEAIFDGSAYFQDCHVKMLADFSQVQFKASAYFSGLKVESDVVFTNTHFHDEVDFVEACFSISDKFSSTDFTGSCFAGESDFRQVDFKEKVDFSCAQFKAPVSFSEARFHQKALFQDTEFKQDADFTRAQIDGVFKFEAKVHSRLSLDGTNLQMLEQEAPADSKGFNFEGAVIEEASLWGIQKLENYSFRNAFLLCLSFADREVINCDFTGATVDAVRTRGWKPDQATLKNTQYIYTDYDVETVVNEASGRSRKVLKPRQASRVPKQGNFGEGEHAGYTLKDFFAQRYA